MDSSNASGHIEATVAMEGKWVVPISKMAEHTVNSIRRIVDDMKIKPNPSYDFISLSIGDPTIFGNLKPPKEAINAILESISSGKYNGYAPAVGTIAAREAVAKFRTTPDAPLTEKDVILAPGCSGAIEIAMQVLANPGDNILIPNPGFPLYKTIAGSHGFEERIYRLLPEREWEADLAHMESLIDERTRFIIVNNPSNPCGSVYSKEHLQGILTVAEKHKLPILADEIYAYSVFKDETFYPIASLTTAVPVLSTGGISKRFLVPGWRLGWILIHDRNDAFQDVRQGLDDLAKRAVKTSTVVQGALPSILSRTPESFFEEAMQFIEGNAEICFLNLSMVPGLKPIKPRGAMYMMVGINEDLMKYVKDDLDFTQQLISTKSVFCLPGSCFGYPNYFRIVLTVPEETMKSACDRIGQFCCEILADHANNGIH